MGYTVDELIGMHINDIEAVETPEETREHIHTLRNKRHLIFESRHRKKNETIIDVEVSCSYVALFDERIFVFTRDISTRKENEKILKYQAGMLKQVSDAVVSTDIHAKITFWNAAAERIYGWNDEEAIGKNIYDLLHTKYANTNYSEVMLKLQYNELWNGEVIQQKKDGESIFIESTVSIMTDDEDSNVIGCVHVNRNITERKNKDFALRDSMENYMALFNAISDAVYAFYIDNDGMPGEIFEVNNVACEMLGYTRDELLKMTIEDINSPDSNADIPEYMNKLSKEKSILFNQQHRNKNGSDIPVFVSARQFLHKGKSAVFATARDVSKMINTENQLYMQALVLDQIKDRVTITDLSGRITYVNEAVVTSSGYKKNEIIGQTTDIYGEDSNRGATQREILERTLQDGHWRGEVVNRMEDGEEVIFDCRTITIVDSQGEKIALCGISTDITDLRANENMQCNIIERQRNELTAITELARSPYMLEGEPELLIRKLTEIAAKVIGVERVGVWCFDKDCGDLICKDMFEYTTHNHSSGTILK